MLHSKLRFKNVIIITIACVLMSEFINKYCPCLIVKKKVISYEKGDSNTL